MKNALFIILFMLIFGKLAFTQDHIDSIYLKYTQFMKPAYSGVNKVLSSGSDTHLKCGLELIGEIKRNQIEIARRYGSSVLAITERPTLQKSIVSPSGFFRVHFDTTGVQAVTYDINRFCDYLDESFRIEVNQMGFPAPVSDNGTGGDDKYDIYIENLGSTYGFTIPENTIDPVYRTVYTFIKIHNDFNNGFFTHGLEAARVTAAHELHHAIQMSNYSYKDVGGIEDLFFYELTSTAMEEFVFDEVNDYYNYLNSFFRYPERTFSNHSGYDLAHWNIFLRQKYDVQFIKKQWEYFRTNRAMISIEKSLKDRNSSFSSMLREFSIWCYYTGFLKQQGLFFEEGEFYPEYEAMITSNFSSSILSDSINTAPASISVIRYCKNNGITKDTISILISNGDYYNAAHDPGKTSKVVVRATTYEMPNSISLSEKYYLFYNHFQATEIFEETIFNNSAAGWVLTSQMVYPNPYKLQSTTLPFICIPVPQNEYESEADFNVYNAAMQLVYSGKKSVLLNVIKWNLKSEHFVTLGTGVYFYIIKTSKNTFTGKFTIING